MVNAVQFFFRTGLPQPSLNYNLLMLLPKTHDAYYVDKLRFWQTVWLILLARESIWFHAWSSYLGHHIQDYTVLASDCVNLMLKHCFGGNVAIKMDVKEAFDTIR